MYAFQIDLHQYDKKILLFVNVIKIAVAKCYFLLSKKSVASILKVLGNTL